MKLTIFSQGTWMIFKFTTRSIVLFNPLSLFKYSLLSFFPFLCTFCVTMHCLISPYPSVINHLFASELRYTSVNYVMVKTMTFMVIKKHYLLSTFWRLISTIYVDKLHIFTLSDNLSNKNKHSLKNPHSKGNVLYAYGLILKS